jgi:hypothetical protein
MLHTSGHFLESERSPAGEAATRLGRAIMSTVVPQTRRGPHPLPFGSHVQALLRHPRGSQEHVGSLAWGRNASAAWWGRGQAPRCDRDQEHWVGVADKITEIREMMSSSSAHRPLRTSEKPKNAKFGR